MNLASLLTFTSDLAYRAGRITLGYFQTGLRPDFKADDSPVTAADRAAEEFIRGEIEKHYPGHAIIGEEFGASAGETSGASAGETSGASAGETSGASHRWIIDPIDGTKSFMRGIPLYGVLIGLEIDGEIRVGAAYYPGTDELLCAADGLGAWWNGRRAQVSGQSDLKRAYICYTNVRNMAKYGRGAAWERLNAATYAARGWSDAYGYLAVATGRAEVMLDPIMNVWDCGPFPVIFREAGGFFGSWSGGPGHSHNEALACNAALLPEVLQLVQGK